MTRKTEIELCYELIRGSQEVPNHYTDDPIPASLSIDYGKRIAAEELGALPRSIVIDAALCRAALTSNEDDRVRTEAVQQLLNSRSHLLEGVLFALLFDDDPEMRKAAVEGLVLARSDNLTLALAVLSDDKADPVYTLAARAANGEDIEVYQLDHP